MSEHNQLPALRGRTIETPMHAQRLRSSLVGPYRHAHSLTMSALGLTGLATLRRRQHLAGRASSLQLGLPQGFKHTRQWRP